LFVSDYNLQKTYRKSTGVPVIVIAVFNSCPLM